MEQASGAQRSNTRLHEHLARLAEIGIALSSEKNLPVLLEKIVDEARSLAGADAGTLYLTDGERDQLEFAIIQNQTMKIRMGGAAGPITWPPIPLHLDGAPNHANVSSSVAMTGKIVNIPDVYQAEGYDFSGTKQFDAGTGYRSQSMLVIPMRNKEREVIGVLQLINALSPESGRPIPFPAENVDLVASLASQAAVAITNVRLYRDLELLFDAFIQAIATAIDEKSPYTAGHIRRVQQLTMATARAINQENTGPLAGFRLNEDQMRELSLAGWLHDIGKIVTPEHVMDKSSKLETIFDRIQLVEARYEVLKRDQRIRQLEAQLAGRQSTVATAPPPSPQADGSAEQLEEEKQFVSHCNLPGEYLGDEQIARLKKIAARSWHNNGSPEPLLKEDELNNLLVRKGNLTSAERQTIENHAMVTYKMLKQLPFPKKLRHVAEYAAAHHEKLDGSGYPFRLKARDIPPQARIIAIADIFEALTSRDRPYKKAMPVSRALRIMTAMKNEGHIDPDIFDLFVKHKVYQEYARRELDPSQWDC
ncbi:HD domain-containing phosphohydrolase [Desulfurivibrio sp. D14AmB]|uniref:HD domain-containing phosphohydrolase n=1 Tax=Desulfurivibrio sp. D14AmB TaxID=3374370 RepID=UPI00376ED44E